MEPALACDEIRGPANGIVYAVHPDSGGRV